MCCGQAGELGFGVLVVGEGGVGLKDGEVVWGEEEGVEGAFGEEGAGLGLEGEASGHGGGDL